MRLRLVPLHVHRSYSFWPILVVVYSLRASTAIMMRPVRKASATVCFRLVLMLAVLPLSQPASAQSGDPGSGGAICTGDPGALGDVKHSILDEATFRQLRGSGWRLLDGAPVDATALCTTLNVCTIPDARGVFIRSVNGSRSPNGGDPDASRQVGSYQKDSFMAHTHRLASISEIGHSVDGNGSSRRLDMNDGYPWQGIRLSTRTTSSGSAETRPRNVALYTYIKVDCNVAAD